MPRHVADGQLVNFVTGTTGSFGNVTISASTISVTGSSGAATTIQSTAQNGRIILAGNRDSGSNGTDVIIQSSVSRSDGNILAVSLGASPFTGLFRIRYDGSAFISGNTSVGDATGTQDAVNVRTLSRAGFENRTDSLITISTGSRFLAIGPVTGTPDFKVWVNNTRFSVTSTVSATWGTASGDWFFFFNASGVLTSSQTVWDLTSDQTGNVGLVYWDGNASGTCGDERHSVYRDRRLHRDLHSTQGTGYGGGLSASFTNTTFAIATGTIYDEDIQFTQSAATTCRLWYRVSGAAGLSMSWLENQTQPYKTITGTLQYESSGSFLPVTPGNFITNYVFATDEISSSIAIVQSQAQYGNPQLAVAVPFPDFTNHNVREWRLICGAVYQNVAGTPTFVSQTDYRNITILPGTPQLATTPATVVTYLPSAPITSTTVQGALDAIANRITPVFGGLYTAVLPAASGVGSDPTWTAASGVWVAWSGALTASLSSANGLCSATIQNGQIQVNADGLYRITAQMTLEVGNNQYLGAGIFLTGTEVPRWSQFINLTNGNSQEFVLSALANLVSGNYVDIRLRHSAGPAGNQIMHRFNFDVVRSSISGS